MLSLLNRILFEFIGKTTRKPGRVWVSRGRSIRLHDPSASGRAGALGRSVRFWGLLIRALRIGSGSQQAVALFVPKLHIIGGAAMDGADTAVEARHIFVVQNAALGAEFLGLDGVVAELSP